MQKILVTGSAGFIGFHVVNKLLNSDFEIIGLDNINDYYDIELKYSRLEEHGISRKNIVEFNLVRSSKYPFYQFIKLDISDFERTKKFVIEHKFDVIIHLAAQAGVRYSIENPSAYVSSNINGFLSIIEGARFSNVRNFIYASTSSVYGLNSKMPLKESMPTEHPMSIYAATKKSNEMIAHSYSHLFNLPTTGLRFFTVYGPWGRPDMALFKFAQSIYDGKPIDIFNNGQMFRDFTYVTDIAESIYRLIKLPALPNCKWDGDDPESCSSIAPYKIYNIGNSKPVVLLDYISQLEKEIGIEAKKNFLTMQPGDVYKTHADTVRLTESIGFYPTTSIDIGIKNFIEWFNNYYK